MLQTIYSLIKLAIFDDNAITLWLFLLLSPIDLDIGSNVNSDSFFSFMLSINNLFAKKGLIS